MSEPNSIAKFIPERPGMPGLDQLGISESRNIPTLETRYECDLCGWDYIRTKTIPISPMELERVLRAHFETHDVTDWLRVIAGLRNALWRIAQTGGWEEFNAGPEDVPERGLRNIAGSIARAALFNKEEA